MQYPPFGVFGNRFRLLKTKPKHSVGEIEHIFGGRFDPRPYMVSKFNLPSFWLMLIQTSVAENSVKKQEVRK